jgi:hypothetical protein
VPANIHAFDVAADLSCAFRAGAEKFCLKERRVDSLTSMCALQYLSNGAACQLDEYAAQKSGDEGREMAGRMKFLGVWKEG